MRSLNPTLAMVLAFIVPVIIGIATRYAMAWLKKGAAFVDNFDPKYQQAIVVAIAFLLTALGKWAGVDLCGGQDCTGLASITAGGLTALLASIFAMVTHNGKKVSQLTNGDDRPGAPVAPISPTSVKVSGTQPTEKFGE